MPTKKLIDILDEMNMKESDTRHRIQRKLDKLASLISDVDRKSPELIFVNHLLEEIIEGKKIVRPELEKCNRIFKQYKNKLNELTTYDRRNRKHIRSSNR